MPTVELRVKVYPVGSESVSEIRSWIPHTFIIVTGPDGSERGYGLAPAIDGQLIGEGKIYNDIEHRYNSTTGKIELTDDGYARLMAFIRSSELNPPWYYLPFGSQCANWAVKALVEAGIPALASPNLLPDDIVRDISETLVWPDSSQSAAPPDHALSEARGPGEVEH
ncbi:MAG: hypothetical protein L6Q68_00850, partial [Aquabacterium sp.]|nr:hypothetical protein [Aquabacterium sp.]